MAKRLGDQRNRALKLIGDLGSGSANQQGGVRFGGELGKLCEEKERGSA